MAWRNHGESRQRMTAVVVPPAGLDTADVPVDPVAEPMRWTAIEFTGPFLSALNGAGGSAQWLVLR